LSLSPKLPTSKRCSSSTCLISTAWYFNWITSSLRSGDYIHSFFGLFRLMAVTRYASRAHLVTNRFFSPPILQLFFRVFLSKSREEKEWMGRFLAALVLPCIYTEYRQHTQMLSSIFGLCVLRGGGSHRSVTLGDAQNVITQPIVCLLTSDAFLFEDARTHYLSWLLPPDVWNQDVTFWFLSKVEKILKIYMARYFTPGRIWFVYTSILKRRYHKEDNHVNFLCIFKRP
jgi:hypothetical protein